MSPAPDAAAKAAAHALDLRRQLREVNDAILARAPEHDLQPSLDRIQAVMELLGDPQHAYPVIHLTGTNGKTSTSRMIDALLTASGLTVGRFTSPHLQDVRERISIGGEPIDAEKFLAAYADVISFVEMVDARSVADGGPRMTYFEVLVAIAYAAFADAPVDVAVIEVGMGGAWDATNVANGAVSVLTPIGLDHAHFLGDTPELIASEKVGIIKPEATVITSLQESGVMAIIEEDAQAQGATLVREGIEIGVLAREVAHGGQLVSLRSLAGDHTDVFLNLHGAYQAHNALLALSAVEAFLGGGEQPLSDEVVAEAFGSVTSPGRLEVVRRSPTVLVDAAHNPGGAQALATALEEEFTFGRLVLVLAVLGDKDAAGIISALDPVIDHAVISRSSSPRSMRPEELGEIAADLLGEHRVTVVENLPDALDQAAALADEQGVSGGVLATGSVTTAADVRMLLGAVEPGEPTQ